MHSARWIAIVLSLAPAGASAAAQARTVKVTGLESRDLQRTAHHLGVEVREVPEIREFLQDATSLALDSELGRRWDSLDHLPRLWRRVHPLEAAAAVRKIFDKLKQTARDAPDASAYGWCLMTARNLVFGLHDNNAVFPEYFKDWPDRQDLGQGARDSLDSLSRQVERDRLRRLVWEDPSMAAEALLAGEDGFPEQAVPDIARRLGEAGRGAEADQLVRHWAEKLSEAPATPQTDEQIFTFLISLANTYPEMFLPVLRTLVESGRGIPIPDSPGPSIRLENDLGSITLSPLELRLYNLLRNMQGRPQTQLEALELLPSLKQRLQRLGGFDRANGGSLVFETDSGETHRQPMRFDPNRFQEFRFYIWGESAENPGRVRAKLEEALPGKLDASFRFFLQRHCADDPAFSRLALDFLLEKARRSGTAAERLAWFPDLLDLQRQCEGQVDAALIQEGFKLIEEVRKNEDSASDESRHFRQGSLEWRLTGEWSRLDADAAAEYIRQIKDPAEKFRAYLALVEGRTRR